jgi:Ca2+-binding RTX toxin-like protein
MKKNQVRASSVVCGSIMHTTRWARGAASAFAFLVALLCANAAEAAIGPWIDAHPKVAYSIKWEFSRQVGPGYYQQESGKVSWPDWSPEQKQALEDAYAEAEAWYAGSDPFNDLNETIEYPPVNLDESVDDDTAEPYVDVTEEYAWDMYIRWVAQTLLQEVEGHFPWSLLDYDTQQLRVLLDSSSVFSRSAGTPIKYGMNTGNGAHPNYVWMEGNKGESLLAPPRFTYAFLAQSGLIGSDRLDTIVRVLDWSGENLRHFEGIPMSFESTDVHWQYRGIPPITRIIEGTTREGSGVFAHWTAGCWGTTGFWRNVLRAANIPVMITNRCSHSLAYFVTEGLYIDHGDAPYNTLFQSLGLSTEELLLDQRTFEQRFGDNPDSNEDYCEGVGDGGYIGHQIDVLDGTVDVCGDGEDNDGDGAIDCEDADDCRPRIFTEPSKMVAPDGTYGLQFGYSLDESDGRVVMVGNAAADGDNTAVGAAYVYEYESGDGWTLKSEFYPSSSSSHYLLGDARIEGDTAVLAKFESLVDGAGTVHVFERQSDDSWTEEVILAPDAPIANEVFGSCLALQGDTLIVGARGQQESSAIPLEGAFYVFERGAGGWQQVERLTTGTGDADLFGASCELSGDLLTIGAPHALGSSDPLDRRGAVHVFRSTGGTFVEETRIQPGPAADWFSFGNVMSIDGDRILIGAHPSTVGGLSHGGRAALYELDAGSWVQTAEFTSPAVEAMGLFGSDVDLQGDLALIGAPGENEALGRVYEYQFDGSSWNLLTTREPRGILGDVFGGVVLRAGENVFVSAVGDPNQGVRTGAVYAYNTGSSPAGACVSVSALELGNPDVSLEFSQAERSGTTTVTTSSSGPALPAGFQLGDPPTFYEISTTADYSGPVRVCIDYSGASYDSSALALLHYESGAWVDLCETERGCSFDPTNEIVCAYVDSLSPFVVAEHSPPDAVFTGASAECTSPTGALITLDGTSSTDPGGSALSYAWSAPGITFTDGDTATPSAQFPFGPTTVTLTVMNDFGLTDVAVATVEVTDHTRPDFTFVPADITTTNCTLSSIGNATGSDLCGGAVTITKNSPAKYAPGTTTVTWTIRDQRGNEGTATQRVTLLLGDDATCCPAGTNVIQGTSNNNTLNGTSGNDCILGKGAQDTINGNGGNDYISGGEGDDIINAGSGNDVVFAGAGQDNVNGSSGNDSLYGGDGDDTLLGGINDDWLFAGQGNDTLRGEDGTDRLFGEDGFDNLQGGNGNDILAGGAANDTCTDTNGTNLIELCEFGAPNACTNGASDGTETGLDCGGGCPPCASGGVCQSGGDCSAGLYCIGLSCLAK